MDSLWERIVVAASGPTITALLALFVLNQVAAWAQRRKEAGETRDSLAVDITETGNSLYLGLQAFWRKAPDIPLCERATRPELADAREKIDTIYNVTRVRGQVLEQRLRICYRSRQPAQC